MTRIHFDSLQAVKDAVDAGKRVYMANVSYVVIKGSFGDYLIWREANAYCIGLTWRDGVTMNCKLDELFMLGE